MYVDASSSFSIFSLHACLHMTTGFVNAQSGFLQPFLSQIWVKCKSLNSSRRVVYFDTKLRQFKVERMQKSRVRLCSPLLFFTSIITNYFTKLLCLIMHDKTAVVTVSVSSHHNIPFIQRIDRPFSISSCGNY